MVYAELQLVVAGHSVGGGYALIPDDRHCTPYTKNSLGGAPTERRTIAVKALALA